MYASLMEEGIAFPPILVYFDGLVYSVVDGFHRVAAAISIGCSQIDADVREGSKEEAIWHALSCNTKHGRQRTAEDLDVVFQKLMKHPRSRTMSNRAIARHIGVSEATVRRQRRNSSASCVADETKVVQRAGRQYAMRVNRIGRSVSHKADTLSCAVKVHKICDMSADLTRMKSSASLEVRAILNVVGHWIAGSSTADVALSALEKIVARLTLAAGLHDTPKTYPVAMPSGPQTGTGVTQSFRRTMGE